MNLDPNPVPGDHDGDGIAGNSYWDVDADGDGQSDYIQQMSQSLQNEATGEPVDANVAPPLRDIAPETLDTLERILNVQAQQGNVAAAQTYQQLRASTFAPGTARGVMPHSAQGAAELIDAPDTTPELSAMLEDTLSQTRSSFVNAIAGGASAVASETGQELASQLLKYLKVVRLLNFENYR